MDQKIELDKIKKIHIIGIEGAGTSALAQILKEMGKEVVGSDEGDHFYYDILKKNKIKVFHQFQAENIKKPDLVIYSTSFKPKTNPELKAALERDDLEVITYPQALGLIFNQKFGIAVCGTHGKTTTTAMLTLAMKKAGADPSAIIGSKVKQLGGGAVVGKSEYFVIEADEYQNKFQHYRPMAVVLTSVDYDHPDFFPTEEAYRKTFEEFVAKIPPHGFLVVCGDQWETLKVARKARCQVVVYGDFKRREEEEEVINFVDGKAKLVKTPADLSLKVPGRHNRLNATAVMAVAKKLGLDEKKVKDSLENFQGTARRFEEKGERNGAIIIDDYAHHPEEVKATLRAVREKYPHKKITAVFHPHTFTRTKALLGQFAQSFEEADKTIVLDIFGSAREKQGDVHSKDLVEKMRIYTKDVEYVPTIEEVVDCLKDKLGQKDVLITMGAGDVWQVAERLASKKPKGSSKNKK